MGEKELRRTMAVLPIGTAMTLTGLSARQIRYYEKQNLVIPKRNASNRRMYSLNDIDALLEIKDYISEGMNIADIKRVRAKQKEKRKTLDDDEVRKLLRDDFISASGMADQRNVSFKSSRHF